MIGINEVRLTDDELIKEIYFRYPELEPMFRELLKRFIEKCDNEDDYLDTDEEG